MIWKCIRIGMLTVYETENEKGSQGGNLRGTKGQVPRPTLFVRWDSEPVPLTLPLTLPLILTYFAFFHILLEKE